MNSVSFSICSLIYIIIFLIVYFGKKRIDLTENKIYSKLLITTTIGLSIDIIGYITFQNGDVSSNLNLMISKIYLVYYFTWAYLLTIYTFVITFKSKIKNNYTKNLTIMYFVVAIIIMLLPVFISSENKSLYSYGPSVNFVYFLSGLCIIAMVACLIINRKEINQKKYIPLLALIVFGGMVAVVQKMYPELLLLTASESIITALMYFTIENPDMQMVEELSKNRKLTEQNFSDKTNFLFKISQDLKNPLLEIKEKSNKILENTKEEQTESLIKEIENSAKQLYTYVNSAIDVSNIDIKNLKIINDSYNVKNLFHEICLRTKTEIQKSNKKIEFRYDEPEDIPEFLIGDKTKIKQIVLSTLFNSIKYTEEGFIELNISTITKYGVCRLMIDISDSGKGIEIDKINSILNAQGELTKEELERIDTLDINLDITNKIIKTLNGNIIIKSEVGKGSSFEIIIDQKIKEVKQKSNEKTLDSYSQTTNIKDKILIVTLDNDIKKQIETELLTQNIDVEQSMFIKDCIEKIKNKEKFKCIIVDDKLGTENGINLIKSPDKANLKKIPLIIMLNKNQEFLSKHYIEDGFNDFIIKEDLKDGIKKLNKYL